MRIYVIMSDMMILFLQIMFLELLFLERKPDIQATRVLDRRREQIGEDQGDQEEVVEEIFSQDDVTHTPDSGDSPQDQPSTSRHLFTRSYSAVPQEEELESMDPSEPQTVVKDPFYPPVQRIHFVKTLVAIFRDSAPLVPPPNSQNLNV